MVAQAQERKNPVNLEAWHALQEWLADAEHRVTIPYGEELAKKIPPIAVRLRRDFPTLLSLIRAHAILHQANREKDPEGRIIASLEDYICVRELVVGVFSEGLEATVPPAVRETVTAIQALSATHQDGVALRFLANYLKIDKSAASRRVDRAKKSGFVKNAEERRGKPGKLVLCDPMPDDAEILPLPEDLRECCTVDMGLKSSATLQTLAGQGIPDECCTVDVLQGGYNIPSPQGEKWEVRI